MFVASGHVDSFADMMTECGKCKEPYRADHLLKEAEGVDVDGMSMGEVQSLIEKKKVRCPKCKGALGKLWDFNLMFKTEIGPGKNKLH